MKNLIIVESPGKIKTISSFLGKDYIVLASKGHIRVLSKTGKYNLGVDVDGDFSPKYENDKEKKDVIKTLKETVKTADKIFLASDADLEGESIAWHLEQVLRLPKTKTFRITFNEITEKAVKDALKNPRQIDLLKVDAQETRRILDRIIGFRLSGVTLSKLSAKSAGRVQSSALRILADREKEITNFIPETYYEIFLPFTKNRKEHKAQYKGTDSKKVVSIKNKSDAEKIISECKPGNYKVGKIISKDRKVLPKPPYITSTFQQEVSAKLNYDSKKAMKIAQSLYEGIDIAGVHYGLITYMRTDSTRLSDDFIKEARVYIEKTYGKEYYLGTSFAKKSEHSQDAHEGIRPTHLDFTPEKLQPFLSVEELKVYTLIFNRAIASLMSTALIKDTEISIYNGEHRFGITGHEVMFDGFLRVYKEYSEDEKDEKTLPEFKIDEIIKDKPLELEKKETTPPSRYTEASLVKKLEELGIGRPSTYAPIIDKLKLSEYIEKNKKSIQVTEKGMKVNNMLEKFFEDIINTTYTANMEKMLDEIAEGKINKLTELKKFYNKFSPLVLKAMKEANIDKPAPKETDRECPSCHKTNLVIRESKYGEFYACKRYPHCKFTEKATKTEPKPTTGFLCPTCGEGMLVERIAGKGKSKGTEFYACNRFPKCKQTLTKDEFRIKTNEFTNLSTDKE